MKLINCLSLVLFSVCINASAQLVNNGAAITVTSGGYIFCQGNLQNNSGTITNNGKIEVQGNFANSGTYTTSTSDDSLLMTGGSAATLNGGSSTIGYLSINKSAGIKVTLAGNTIVGTKLDYTQGILTTDPINTSYYLQSPASATYSFAAGREIIGRVKRTAWANGSAIVFNQPNMLITTNSGTAPTDFTVNMIPQSEGGDPTQSEREVKRYFQFAYTGGSGFTTDARFPYVAGDLNTNVEANLIPWKLNSGEWTGRLNNLTRDAGNDYVQTTAIPADTTLQEWKLADPYYAVSAQVYLRGPWNSTNQNMNTSLNSGGVLPLSNPYNITPFNYAGSESVGSIPNANVVDWVLLEIRKPSTGLAADAGSATITGRKAVFVLNNGSIVDLDGSSTPSIPVYKQGSGNYIAVRHRNHLGVLSNASSATSTGFSNDFRVLGNVFKSVSATSDPVVLLTSSSSYGMWAGDANKSNVVNSTDVNAVKSAIAQLLSGYQLSDVNMSNSINATDVNLVKTTISGLGSSSNPARMQQGSNRTDNLKSHLPE